MWNRSSGIGPKAHWRDVHNNQALTSSTDHWLGSKKQKKTNNYQICSLDGLQCTPNGRSSLGAFISRQWVFPNARCRKQTMTTWLAKREKGAVSRFFFFFAHLKEKKDRQALTPCKAAETRASHGRTVFQTKNIEPRAVTKPWDMLKRTSFHREWAREKKNRTGISFPMNYSKSERHTQQLLSQKRSVGCI